MRIIHQQSIIINMGTIDFPHPLKILAIQWEKESRK